MICVNLLQWYVSAVTGPRVTYLIIHVTENLNLEKMQMAGSKFLKTLAPGGYVAVHFGSEERNFLPVNQTNIEAMEDFIDRQSPNSPTASLNDTFEMVFERFEALYGELSSTIGPCQGVIVLFSDSPLNPKLINQIEGLQLNLTQQVDIFTYTFGGLSVDPTVSQDIACSFQGEWFGVGSRAQPDVNDVIVKYLNFYPMDMSRDHVTWMMDEGVLNESVLIGCLPVHEGNSSGVNVPLGVSCVEVDLQAFKNLDGREEVRNT